MNSIQKTASWIGVLLLALGCADTNSPNYQFMPNMYEAVGYEAYDKVTFLPDGSAALYPAPFSIPRGKLPYVIPNDPEGKELARTLSSPLDSLKTDENRAAGQQLYTIYCAVCHGDNGDGQGMLVQREKILGVPSYSDPARNINVGTTYHVIYHGLNSMGSYASQLNHEERWQVSEYVMSLKQELSNQ